MSDRVSERIARRRREMKQRQVRRRRLALGGVLIAVLLVAGLIVLTGQRQDESPAVKASSGQQSDGTGSSRKAPEDGSGGSSTGGAQPDSTWKPSKAPVPILMYHVIGDPAGEVALPDLYLSVSDFQDQVDWLAGNSYTPVTLVQVQNAWYDGGTLPEKPIVLSFDDGYLGQYLDAMPILRKKGWAGQLNLKSEGSDLSSKQVKKMIKAGWEIASHTTTHPDLPSLDAAALETEIAGSKKILERDLGIEIHNFCYPAGQYDDTVIAAVKAAGYRGATTVNPGIADRNEPFELKRIRINRGDGSSALAYALGSA